MVKKLRDLIIKINLDVGTKQVWEYFLAYNLFCFWRMIFINSLCNYSVYLFNIIFDLLELYTCHNLLSPKYTKLIKRQKATVIHISLNIMVRRWLLKNFNNFKSTVICLKKLVIEYIYYSFHLKIPSIRGTTNFLYHHL